ncbi:UPF0462 protein C4orf33 [Heterocephalus glaber]|uniref:UPF0462 protein C4orf33 n=1 Tax=Heterocephalus glaber TaxID=10181 RepID=A0AAX6RGI0_HETGA|nr:UPF0462 protein C4orf33 [Heterocephalus glaber]XP_021095466.1 UPF0462 protein C4orf33 [Heterocephalus glaber]XP_021095467.1 UPF0462 protein C4orf33 [Heterocephalus glaber]XP_021095468.1 UPF0462 protein C4orf33 [Heterocephalus glaber]XP_021095469.1 UPF0462 protein C4orf33 [Heterocephalus glaber]
MYRRLPRFMLYMLRYCKHSLQMDFRIEHTWDGFPVKHEPVLVRLNPGDGGIMMEVHAPFFNDPPAPLGEPGKPFNELWDYEGKKCCILLKT